MHGHLVNALGEAALAMLVVGHCQLSRLALAGRAGTTVPSRQRRWQRLVANAHLDVHAVVDTWARHVLRGSGEQTLILDETPQHNHLRAMKLSRQVRGRAIPALWHCYRPDALPMTQDALVLDLLGRAAHALPVGAQPILLADRGLSWPAVLDFCVAHRWHYLLRIQGQTRVQLDDGRELSAAALAQRPGRGWCGWARVFKKAGWRRTGLVAWWAPGVKEPWLLISDLPPNRRRCRQYRKRMRIEESFRDEKSHGFRWNDSRIRMPDHAARLLLVMAVAMATAISLGLRLIANGHRWLIERRHRREQSVFQLGLRHVQRLAHAFPARL
jgi:hypothetical protein